MCVLRAVPVARRVSRVRRARVRAEGETARRAWGRTRCARRDSPQVATQGALHPETLVAKNQLGQLLHDRGRQAGWLDEALPLLQDTLAGRLEVLGDDHPQTFNARSALSRLLKDMGRHEEARTVLRPEDVAKLKRFVGSTHRVSVAAAETLEEQTTRQRES